MDYSSPLFLAIVDGEEPIYHPNTGHPTAERQNLSAAARAGLEAPRFCQICGRRMKVQVRPDGWSAECSRHGQIDSAAIDVVTSMRHA